MPHPMMHMVDQIEELGPMYLHQMWTYEQFMSTLNRYVHNRAYPEGSMIEAYMTEEAINWCMRYIRDGSVIGLPVHQHEGPVAMEVAPGMKTPPAATSQPSMSTSHCPPLPKKPSGDRAEAVPELPYSIAFERYGTCFHTSYTQLYNMLLVACLHTPTFLSMFF
jgi:hypothetical protein